MGTVEISTEIVVMIVEAVVLTKENAKIEITEIGLIGRTETDVTLAQSGTTADAMVTQIDAEILGIEMSDMNEAIDAEIVSIVIMIARIVIEASIMTGTAVQIIGKSRIVRAVAVRTAPIGAKVGLLNAVTLIETTVVIVDTAIVAHIGTDTVAAEVLIGGNRSAVILLIEKMVTLRRKKFDVEMIARIQTKVAKVIEILRSQASGLKQRMWMIFLW